MVKCNFFLVFLVLCECISVGRQCLAWENEGYCENHETGAEYMRVVKTCSTASSERWIKRHGVEVDNRQVVVGCGVMRRGEAYAEKRGLGAKKKTESPRSERVRVYGGEQTRTRRYFTNLNPSDCRITILRRRNIEISKSSVAVMESFERLVQLLDILSSRRPCPYCRGCADLRLDSLPIWVSQILQRQIRRVNSQLDNKLCLILKKDSKLNALIRRIIWSIKEEKWSELHTVTAKTGGIRSLVARTRLRRRENFPLYLLGGVFELVLDDLRQAGTKISSCHPSQFLFKCSWHPNKQNLEISARLQAVSESMLAISKSLEPDPDAGLTEDKGFKLSSRRFPGEARPFFRTPKRKSDLAEKDILNKDIIKIPTSPSTQGSGSAVLGGTLVDSNLSSALGASNSLLQKKCCPPFLDSLIILRDDGSPDLHLEICSQDIVKHRQSKWEETEESYETRTIRTDKTEKEEKKKKKNLKVIQGVPYVSQLAALHYDYASSSSNSKLLSWSEGVLRPKSVQSSNPDSYLLVPCNKPMWFVIGFQEDIFLEYIALFSLEYFSSSFREIEISGSLVYPTKQWVPIGILRRNEVLPKEMFDLKTLCVRREGIHHNLDNPYYSLDEHASPKGSKASEVKESTLDRPLDKTVRSRAEGSGRNDGGGKDAGSGSSDGDGSGTGGGVGVGGRGGEKCGTSGKERKSGAINDDDDDEDDDYYYYHQGRSGADLRKDSGMEHIKEDNSIQDSNPCWVRYIRVRAISYYEEGHYYCHLNRIQIFGNNVINRLEVEMGGGDRRSSISISETEESVKDVENRLWKGDLDRELHGTIHGQKPHIMYINSSDLSSGTGIKTSEDISVPGLIKPESRSLLVKTAEKTQYIEKREIYEEEADSFAARHFSSSKGHPLLSLIDRVKALERQLDAVLLERRAIIAGFNSSLDSVNESIYRLSNSVKFLQDILMDSNLNNTSDEQNNAAGQIRNLKLGDTYLSQSLNLIGGYLEIFLGNYYSGEVISYLTILLGRVNSSLLNLITNICNHLRALVVTLLFTALFISQLILFKKYISLKRRLHNTLQFFKSYSQNSSTSPKNGVILDETIYFQKNLNLKLHSNPVNTSSFRLVGIPSSNYNINSFASVGGIKGGNSVTEGDPTATGVPTISSSNEGSSSSTKTIGNNLNLIVEGKKVLNQENEAACMPPAGSEATHQRDLEIFKVEHSKPQKSTTKQEQQGGFTEVPEATNHSEKQ